MNSDGMTPQQRDVARLMIEFYDEWKKDDALSACPHEDKLVKGDSFAFLLAILLDGQVAAGTAVAAPRTLKKRLKARNIDFTPAAIAATHLGTLKAIANETPKLHRYPNVAAKLVKQAAEQVVRDYRGDADLVFDVYSARELYLRLINFNGIGDKKANMGVRLAVEYVGYDYYDVDQIHVPVDVHVIRVFRRAGLVGPLGERQEIQSAAKLASPDAPWKLDSAWPIGATWCRPQAARCDGEGTEASDEWFEPCPLAAKCPRLTHAG
jgi:uncharacterized HhH-GPD family protein